MHSFNAQSVLQLDANTSSVQLNHAITFCKDWIEGKQHFTFHTSGSTGTPKKIELTRAQLQASATGTIEALQITSADKILVCLNTQLIAGAMMLVRGLLAGCELFIDDPSSDPLKEVEPNHKLTFASFVPMQLHGLVKNERDIIQKLNRFTHILVGGAAIHPILENKLAQLTCKVYHTYGMTETVSHIALKQIGKDACFTTLPGVEIKTDERECLCIKSASTSNEWVITNDRVEVLNDTQFVLLGREDDVINSGGIKLFPAKIEAALFTALAILNISVTDLFVAAQQDDVLGEKLIAILCGDPLSIEQENWLKEKLKEELSGYEIPKAFYYLPSFMRTESGKIDKINTLKKL